jgi:hypothetical protein
VFAGACVLGGLEVVGTPDAVAQSAGFLSASQRATLAAAVAQIVPASGPGDWSAADLGVVDYIDNLLSGFDLDVSTGAIFPGGPYRDASGEGSGFYKFQQLSRVKRIGWQKQVIIWQELHTIGLAQLDHLAQGSFAKAPSGQQIAVLEGLDG